MDVRKCNEIKVLSNKISYWYLFFFSVAYTSAFFFKENLKLKMDFMFNCLKYISIKILKKE